MRASTSLLVAALIAGSLPAQPHHSNAVIDGDRPVWVQGTVVRYRPGAPHALLELEAVDDHGRSGRWILEGPFPGRMARIIALYGGGAEAYLKPGDSVEACGFPPKSSYPVRRSYGDERMDLAHFIHAPLLVMPGGQWRAWGPYGRIDRCLRAGDKTESWRAFLNRDPLARDLWCSALRQAAAGGETPPAIVQDVNRGLNAPCR